MRNALFSCLVICASVATLGCREPSPDWNGTWEVNLLKSNFQGPIFTVSVSPDGEYRYDGANSSFTFRCDGRDWPMEKNRTQACVISGTTVLELTRKENGLKTNAYHWELSAGGRILTSAVTVFRKSGAVIVGEAVASRISGSNGFAGQWRDQSYLQRHVDMALMLDGQALHISYPRAGEYIDATLDGVDAPVHGPHTLNGVTYAISHAGPHQLWIRTKQNGKILAQGSLELSRDGTTITNSWSNPDRPADKGTLVYDKK